MACDLGLDAGFPWVLRVFSIVLQLIVFVLFMVTLSLSLCFNQLFCVFQGSPRPGFSPQAGGPMGGRGMQQQGGMPHPFAGESRLLRSRSKSLSKTKN